MRKQASFRTGRSCCGKILNLTQYIENSYKQKLIIGMAFIALTAVYGNVNHRILLHKVNNLIEDNRHTIIGTLLQNWRFFVTLNGKHSGRRLQKNRLPQGSVLSLILYNIYTINQFLTTHDY